MKKFKEYKGLDLSLINKEVLTYWKENQTFAKSISSRQGRPHFVFYEGPPSANGTPGIHHVMARTIKDIFCRYKTQKGFQVQRKAGWDTHGLPVELGVEKLLGITKEDIGKTITVAEYNAACRKEVMKYTDQWEDLTEKIGYWVDMTAPYITYDNRYIETLWWLLKAFYNKGLLYKGYTIQPYSPAAGTGLSTHELNQPGCYRDVKDTTLVAQFKVLPSSENQAILGQAFGPTIAADHLNSLSILAWTTTPWTLPSNTALAVGKSIDYVWVESFNPYSGVRQTYVLAKDLFPKFFPAEQHELAMETYQPGDKHIPYRLLGTCKGEQLLGLSYAQLMPWIRPMGDAFRVIPGDFVTTEDGTGIVHIAPTFGADDDRAAKAAGISPLVVMDQAGSMQPMVDKTGKFYRIEDLDNAFVRSYVDQTAYGAYAGRFVKNAYDPSLSEQADSLDVDLSVFLKLQGLAYKIEKQVHSYPHCWRTDKPVLYYPLDSWFIKSTAAKENMIALNKTIGWKPESTGTGRFGKWLENLQDWNLSRSRYWGTPLPIWRSEDGTEERCIGSVEELYQAIDEAVAAGIMPANPYKKLGFVPGEYSEQNYQKIDLHRPHVDDIFLCSPTGKKMIRETDLIDVWFDSGAMPYAQIHFPFEIPGLSAQDKANFFEGGQQNPRIREAFSAVYPADFIAEGVDQTRGWFFTLHAIASMLFDSVAFKHVVSNGLVLDKDGNKMSKRLGNAVDPFTTIESYGSDTVRWYMTTNAQPWDNLKFDMAGVDEVKRKFFGTLYNTYSFFSLYANVDGYTGREQPVPVQQRPEIDRWILSLLHSLIKEVDESYADYESTRAGRAIQDFVIGHLSNWYVRLNRKRFWGGSMTQDKLAAYQTLHTCLETVSMLAAPIAPFYCERLYQDLNAVSGRCPSESVHLGTFPTYDEALIHPALEEQMALAQQITSMVLALRRKVNIKVRQPLCKIMVPVLSEEMLTNLTAIKALVMSEVNVKEMELLTQTQGILVKNIKANFKTLGPKYGKQMKAIAAAMAGFSQADIARLEAEGSYTLNIDGGSIQIGLEDAEITSQDIPGWLVLTENKLTVALDITVTDELLKEGLARELVNRIQNLRKENGFEVTDRIDIAIETQASMANTLQTYGDYIKNQVLANSLTQTDTLQDAHILDFDEFVLRVSVKKAGV